MTNSTLSPTALLRPLMPGIYNRNEVYDPTWTDPSYAAYQGNRVVPYPTSIVKDTDGTPLWVLATDPVTFVPSYSAIPLSTENENVVSLLNYGNTVLRLYVDNRAAPYPATPDSKCVFIGKSPRYYTLTRYAGTTSETIISQYFDSTGTLVSQMVPLVTIDPVNQSSWYLPKCSLNVVLGDNEQILVKVFDESGAEVYSANLLSKQSAVINENVIYAPSIANMTVTANQTLANGVFFLYEKQDFSSLGLSVTLIYTDGTTLAVPIDNVKCFLYGQSDFISSFAGLTQTLTVKYFRSAQESISPSISDATGQMISKDIQVTVIPNTFSSTNKIVPIPVYNTATGLYTMSYWMYYGSGKSHTNVTGYVSIISGTLYTDAAHYGLLQTYVIEVDMNLVDRVSYPTSTIYQQNIALQFGIPSSLVKWSFRDSATSIYVYGLDNSSARRPLIKYDATLKQYFVPSYIFGNAAAFINSFYTQASPPYDPTVVSIPQQPTHFVLRDINTGNMIISAPIPIASYSQAFSIIGDTTGNYLNATVMVEFLNVINTTTTNILYGVPVNVSAGTYIS